MTRLNAKYPGFTLAAIAADRFALSATMTCDIDVRALHAIKNVSHVLALESEIRAFSVNYVLYTAV